MTGLPAFKPFRLVQKVREDGKIVFYDAAFMRGTTTRPVVLKVWPTAIGGLDKLEAQQFEDARAATAHPHANVVAVCDFGWNEGMSYLAIDCERDQRDLNKLQKRARVRKHGVDVTGAVSIAVETCQAMQHLASSLPEVKGVKPMVTPLDIWVSTQGGVKVVPVRSFFASALSARQVLYYLAPEQAVGGAATEKSAVFVIASLLFELLCGEKLLGEGTETEIVQRMLEIDTDKAVAAHPEIPAALQPVLRTALSREPQRRQRDPAALSAELAQSVGAAVVEHRAAAIRDLIAGLFPEEAASAGALGELTPSFGVRLPIAGSGPAPAGQCRHKVLVADDSSTIRAVIKVYLVGNQLDYLEAADGRAAFELARRELPRLIISDINMPELNGLDLCRKVKADATLAKTPFVLLTSKKDDEDRRLGADAGADAYLTKPVGSDELEEVIQRLLGITFKKA
ncbi:MAG: response regulator [Deltaproteobacteria bacterium]|nr:response regulator [Deltaproteobacteria bacterium]